MSAWDPFAHLGTWAFRELVPYLGEPGHRVLTKQHGLGVVADYSSSAGRLAYRVQLDSGRQELVLATELTSAPLTVVSAEMELYHLMEVPPCRR